MLAAFEKAVTKAATVIVNTIDDRNEKVKALFDRASKAGVPSLEATGPASVDGAKIVGNRLYTPSGRRVSAYSPGGDRLAALIEKHARTSIRRVVQA